MTPLLTISNLRVSANGTEILHGMNLTIHAGEIHAIMGPNGAGKSTLSKVLAGHPSYHIDEGEITFCGHNLLTLLPEERAHIGLFLSFQHPIELPGVSTSTFLHASVNAIRKAQKMPALNETAFRQLLEEKMALLSFNPALAERDLNAGFSGGEQKRNEILQMAVLDPRLAILDETDSGLDIDAMKIVAHGVNAIMTPEKGLILITHYQRLLHYIKPTVVHVMMKGRIVMSGGSELALKLEEKGYDWLQSLEASHAR